MSNHFYYNRLLALKLVISIVGIIYSSLALAETKGVVLFHTNDIESVYEPIEAVWRDDIKYMGGIPYLASLISQQRAKHPISFLFDAGDIFTGALSKKSEGKLPFDLYSAMDYDVMTLGNHEFEYGWETLHETMFRASFPVLNANIIHEKSGSLLAQPYTILNRGGVSIGVVGVMGVDAFYNTMASFHRTGLTIKDPVESAQYWVDKIKGDVNMIVVLTHQNKTAPMQTNKEADPSVQRGFDEDYAMAGMLKDVDVIFGGHSDNGLLSPVVHPKTGTVIGLTFGQGMHLGYTRFNVDTVGHNVEYIEGKLIPVDSGTLARDDKAFALIDTQRQLYPELTKVVATIDRAAMRKYNQESSIGNLLTDMMRDASKADIALLNSGAIRADLNAGNITKEDLINVYPFVDKLTTIELSGKQVKQLVEYSCTLPYGIAQFSGLSLVYDPEKPAMQRVRQLQINGKDIADGDKYTVATSGFVASGGDGYEIFTQGKSIGTDIMMSDAILKGFQQRGRVALPDLDRQRMLQ